jgi:phosphate uptake regulator
LFDAVIVIALETSIFMSCVSMLFGILFWELPFNAFFDLLAVVVSTMTFRLILSFFEMVVGFTTFKKGLDPDMIEYPIMSTVADIARLRIDLAYSSLLLHSKELAEEVQKLEEHVDKLHTDFELLALSSGSKKEEAKGFLGLIRLGVVTEKIADAAAEIAEVVLREIEPHPVLKLTIEEAKETVTYIKVSEKLSSCK